MSIFQRAEYNSIAYRAPKDFSLDDSATKIVILGSGNPFPNPMRGGPATAIIANKKLYFIDAGEGIWRAMANAVMHHSDLLEPIFTLDNIEHMFITHLHADHTIGLPSFLLSPYKFNAPKTKEIYGPPGTKNMVNQILAAYEVDINTTWKRSGHNELGWRANAYEISEEGMFFEDANIQIEAFKTHHGFMDCCWAFKFTTDDRTIVVGGDGRYSQNLVKAVSGADLFIADICSEENLRDAPWGGSIEERVKKIKKYHMMPKDLVKLQDETGVKNVVMYHEQSFMSDEKYTREGLAEEVKRAGFQGNLYSSVDCDIY